MTLTSARIVNEAPDRTQFFDYPPATGPLALHEILGLATTLNDAGYDTGDVLARVDAIATALDVALNPDPRQHPVVDLLSLAPDAVVALVRQAGVDRAAHDETVQARVGFDAQLARDAAASLRTHSDAVITSMRGTFDPALAVVRAAADAGLTPHTDTGALLASGSNASIKAYRGLLAAVPTLDTVARMRMEMAGVAGIGSRDVPVANFLAAAANQLVLDGAANTFRGEVEMVQHNLPFTGSYLAQQVKPRLGGRWLAMHVAGFDVRLNTADETSRVLTTAQAAEES